MCKWYCLSTGVACNLQCLHCGVRYCSACLHGEAGKMKSLTECAKCGKKPRTLDNNKRGTWQAQSVDSELVHEAHHSPDAEQLKLRQELRKSAVIPHAAPAAAPASKAHRSLTEDISQDAMMEKLQGVYNYYCAFAPAANSLDIVKWKKAVTDMGLLDKNVTVTDIDLIFTKVKDKDKRRIEFPTFVKAMSELAHKRYNPKTTNVKDPLAALVATDLADASTASADDSKFDTNTLSAAVPDVPSKSPRTSKSPRASVESSGGASIFDKLTNPALYTGAHKHRFDDSGHGRGLDGRDSVAKGATVGKFRGDRVDDLSQVTRPHLK